MLGFIFVVGAVLSLCEGRFRVDAYADRSNNYESYDFVRGRRLWEVFVIWITAKFCLPEWYSTLWCVCVCVCVCPLYVTGHFMMCVCVCVCVSSYFKLLFSLIQEPESDLAFNFKAEWN